MLFCWIVWFSPVFNSALGRSAVMTTIGVLLKSASIIEGSKLAVAVPDVVKTALGLREDLEIPNVKNPAVLSSIILVQLKFLFSANDNINGVFLDPGQIQISFIL